MMERKKNTRPGAPTSERVKDPGRASRQGHVSSNYNTMTTAGRQSGIAGLLSYGQENAVPLRQLAAWAGLDRRTIRHMIEAERRAGVLIVSDNRHGYYFTDDPGEAQRFARSMQHRAQEIRRTARAIERAAGLL